MPRSGASQDAFDFAHSERERLIAALKASRAGTWRWNIADDFVEWDDAVNAPMFKTTSVRVPDAPELELAQDPRQAFDKLFRKELEATSTAYAVEALPHRRDREH